MHANRQINEIIQTVLTNEKEIIRIQASQEQKMMPCLLLLNSSLNVEFVYAILKGICKFTLLNFTGNEFTAN